ncbi:MAG TPA: NAD(P)H-dependent oxidoreductase [Burkholderiaceae bacterium]
MAQTRIAVIVGSLRRESFNRQLADAIGKLVPADVRLDRLEIGDLPLFNQDHEQQPTDAVRRLKEGVRAAQGVIFVTPEYNRSVPGVLKNALDQGSRPYGQSVWARKPAGVIGMSVGAIGTSLAQQHLRNILAYLDMPTLGQPEAFLQHKDGTFLPDGSLDERVAGFVGTWVAAYLDFVRRHAA